jgi:hypothetical protein
MTGTEIVAISQLTTIILGMCLGSIVLIIVAALFKAPEATVQLLSVAVQSGLIIRMTTALVIALAVFGLRLANLISAEAAIATLSGIAGYVLGGQAARLPTSQDQKTPTTPQPS